MTSLNEEQVPTFTEFRIPDGTLVLTDFKMDSILGDGVSSLTVTSGAS